MGASSLNADENLRIYLSLTKPSYYAGEYVQGTIHINCLENRPHQNLLIKIEGKEHTYVFIRRGNVYLDAALNSPFDRNTYTQDLVIAQFTNGIPQGQYNFPFSILLPSSLPASLYIDK